MRQVDPLRPEFPRRWMAYSHWPLISTVVCALLLALVLAVFRTRLRALDVFSALLLFGAAVLSILIVLYTRSLRRAQQVQLDTEERLQQMADNIQEIFWMIDAKTKKALSVTAAYETITGRSCQSLLDNPSSYEELIHPEDRVHVLAKLGEATQTGHFDERFRIVRPAAKCVGSRCMDFRYGILPAKSTVLSARLGISLHRRKQRKRLPCTWQQPSPQGQNPML